MSIVVPNLTMKGRGQKYRCYAGLNRERPLFFLGIKELSMLTNGRNQPLPYNHKLKSSSCAARGFHAAPKVKLGYPRPLPGGVNKHSQEMMCCETVCAINLLACFIAS